ncbi:MAG: RNA recognition motif domain-containing protein [Vicinamibacterales bacterium]
MPPVRLFIGNLPYQATEDDLRSHFAAVGEPTQIVRPLDRETGRARGFAFVEYAERSAAEEAIKRFDGQLFMGRPLAVSEARARDDRGPGGPRPGGGFGGPRPGGFSGPPRPGGFSGPRPPGGGFGGPRPGGPGAGPPGKDFGPPAPPKKKGGKNAYAQKERGPKGPIPTKFTGRMYDLDDPAAEDEANDDLPDFMKPETDLNDDEIAGGDGLDETDADQVDEADADDDHEQE